MHVGGETGLAISLDSPLSSRTEVPKRNPLAIQNTEQARAGNFRRHSFFGACNARQDFLISSRPVAIVAAIALIRDSVSWCHRRHGSCPLLGPILGFAFRAALGETDLLFGSTALWSWGVALALSVRVDLFRILLILRAGS